MKKLKNRYGWLQLLVAAMMVTGFTACTTTEDKVDDPEQPEKPKPEVPVNNDDWQTVPAAGGTIEKDDIAITFPSGTFNADSKVAITEVKKGQIGGDDEVSKFYQIMMPLTTNRPTTIGVKAAKADDVYLVFHAPSLGRSTGSTDDTNYFLETNYSDGKYTAQLTTFDNDGETTNSPIIVGLVHSKPIVGVGARAVTRSSDGSIAEGETKGIKWKLFVESSANKPSIYYNALNPGMLTKMGKYLSCFSCTESGTFNGINR